MLNYSNSELSLSIFISMIESYCQIIYTNIKMVPKFHQSTEEEEEDEEKQLRRLHGLRGSERGSGGVGGGEGGNQNKFKQK
jgi:hypothetical protein